MKKINDNLENRLPLQNQGNSRAGRAYFSIPMIFSGLCLSVALPAIMGYSVANGEIDFNIKPMLLGPGLGVAGSAMFAGVDYPDPNSPVSGVALLSGVMAGVFSGIEVVSYFAGYAAGNAF